MTARCAMRCAMWCARASPIQRRAARGAHAAPMRAAPLMAPRAGAPSRRQWSRQEKFRLRPRSQRALRPRRSLHGVEKDFLQPPAFTRARAQRAGGFRPRARQAPAPAVPEQLSPGHGKAGAGRRLRNWRTRKRKSARAEAAGISFRRRSTRPWAPSTTRHCSFSTPILLVPSEDRLLIIDQHALHERLNFDSLFKELQDREYESQQLAVPIMIEVAPSQVKLLESNLPCSASSASSWSPSAARHFR
jgi:DNA mismatch repair ATPase MutL